MSIVNAIGPVAPLDAAALRSLWQEAQQGIEQAAEAQQQPAPQPATAAAMAAQAEPVRLATLQSEAAQFAFHAPPRERRQPADAEVDAAPESEEPPRRAAEPVEPEQDWRAVLARRWTQATDPAARRALELARAQWAAGRRVLLACAAGRQPDAATGDPVFAELGWGALLLGRDAGGQLRLEGRRWPLRLQWRQRPATEAWFCARAVKEAQPGLAWQLSPCPEDGAARAAVALQLGPLLDGERRWQHLGLRLESARPFREALGAQWSVWLLATLGAWMDGEQQGDLDDDAL